MAGWKMARIEDVSPIKNGIFQPLYISLQAYKLHQTSSNHISLDLWEKTPLGTQS